MPVIDSSILLGGLQSDKLKDEYKVYAALCVDSIHEVAVSQNVNGITTIGPEYASFNGIGKRVKKEKIVDTVAQSNSWLTVETLKSWLTSPSIARRKIFFDVKVESLTGAFLGGAVNSLFVHDNESLVLTVNAIYLPNKSAAIQN